MSKNSSVKDISKRDFELIVVNDFFDDKYLDEQLPDDFFTKHAVRFAQDVQVYVARDPPMIRNVETSVYQKFLYDQDAIAAGPKFLQEQKYSIIHDEKVVDSVYDWYCEFEEGSRKIFPNVEISSPIFSKNSYDTKKSFLLQKYFMSQGFSLVDPTFGECDELVDVGRMVSEHPLKACVENVFRPDDLMFSSYNYKEKHASKGRLVGMEFNPYHPVSVTRLQTLHVDGYVSTGTYLMGGKIYDFRYDLQSKLYRVCSDQWLPAVQCDPYLVEMFDLVANFDFFSFLRITTKETYMYFDSVTGDFSTAERKKISTLVPRRSVLQPVFIEPLITTREPTPGYSIVGPWEGELQYGIRDRFYVPFVTPSIPSIRNDHVSHFRDVTKFFVRTLVTKSPIRKYFKFDKREWCDHCFHWKDFYSPRKCTCDFFSKYTENTLPYYYKGYDSVFSIYAPYVNGSRFLTIDTKINTFPYNAVLDKSITYPVNSMTLIQAFTRSLSTPSLCEFFSTFSQPYTADLKIKPKSSIEVSYVDDLLGSMMAEKSVCVLGKDFTQEEISQCVDTYELKGGLYSNCVLVEGSKDGVDALLHVLRSTRGVLEVEDINPLFLFSFSYEKDVKK